MYSRFKRIIGFSSFSQYGRSLISLMQTESAKNIAALIIKHYFINAIKHYFINAVFVLPTLLYLYLFIFFKFPTCILNCIFYTAFGGQKRIFELTFWNLFYSDSGDQNKRRPFPYSLYIHCEQNGTVYL